MGVQEPIFEDFINNADVTCVRKVFEKAKANGAAFIHFVTSDKLLFHGKMKRGKLDICILWLFLLSAGNCCSLQNF